MDRLTNWKLLAASCGCAPPVCGAVDRSTFEAFRLGLACRFGFTLPLSEVHNMQRVPGARVVYLGNVGHYVFVTREAEVLREIRGFLASLQGP